MPILPPHPVTDLDEYVAGGGGRALKLAREVGPDALIATVTDAGLRGRGGAGFPTGVKWRAVADHRAGGFSTTVVVNAAEGEPGSYKDRTILRFDPYSVLEGALVAAVAVGADAVIVAMKASFVDGLTRVRTALDEASAAGWCEGLEAYVVEGPDAYLFGEETALLEVLDGKPPFPRIAPPYREGVEASPIPTLVDNVETLANVPAIIVDGPAAFRSVGTEQSPGTMVCTVTGAAASHGVGEFPMGTPIRDVLDALGGPGTADAAVAVLPGVSGPIIPAARFGAPLAYEAADVAVGTGGFIVLGPDDDLVAVAEGVSRFLAVESCGQCTPCKADGLKIHETLQRIRTSKGRSEDLDVLGYRVGTVSNGARCALGRQHEAVIGSVLQHFPEELRRRVDVLVEGVEPYLVAPLLGFEDGRAVLDGSFATKQPDWTHDEVDSGQWPAGN